MLLTAIADVNHIVQSTSVYLEAARVYSSMSLRKDI